MNPILRSEKISDRPHSPIRIISPYPFTHRIKAASEDKGTTLIRLLSNRFPFRSACEWSNLINRNRISVNAICRSPDYILKPGDIVEYYNPALIEPSVPDNIEILDETPGYLVVRKPAPMPVHPGGRYHKNSLTEILKSKGFGPLTVLHRLDAVTSGLLILGKKGAFSSAIAACFRNGMVEKNYYALVEGIPPESSLTVEVPVARKKGFVFECRKGADAKPAVTQFRVIQRFKNRSIISCRPVTGRTHQIRLHLQYWGYPVVGDSVYSGKPGSQHPGTIQRSAIELLSSGIAIDSLAIQYSLPLPSHWNDNMQTNNFNDI